MSASTGSRHEFARAMGPVARELLGEPNNAISSKTELRFRNRGSMCVDLTKGTWFDQEANKGGGVLDFVQAQRNVDKEGALEWLHERGHIPRPDTKPRTKRIVHAYDYTDAAGRLLFQVVRYEPKEFRQRVPDGMGGWVWKMDRVQRALYRLPFVMDAIAAGRTIYIAEGEKAVDALVTLGVDATCAPGGANKWRPDYSASLLGADVVLLPDNDEPGRKSAENIATMLQGFVAKVRVLALPDLAEKADPFDWIEAGGTREALEALAATIQPYNSAPKSTHDTAAIEGFDLTEDGLALAFTKAHQDQLRYDHTRGAWFHWTGKSWRQDETKLAFSWSRGICRRLSERAEVSPKTFVILAKAATASAVERFAQSDPALAVTSAIWDRDPFLLGTPAGTVDLRTCKLRDPIPEDYITKLTAVEPSDVPNCPQWLAFLEQVTGRDFEFIRFLRQWCGYCLTGDVSEHALLFAYGPGGNGKGVFLNTVRNIIGGYAVNAAMDTFTASNTDKHPTDLAMLRGARLVTASETEDGRAWAESRIKSLTGGDPITARFMRQDFFEYLPQFKLTIIGNHKPILRNVDDAARRRFNMAPFLFKPTVVDKELENKLRSEWPGILRWMIEGCLDWQMNGLVRPSVVTDATAEYFSEQDTVNQWVQECCIVSATQSDTLAVLFKSWTDYAIANGEKPGTTKWFSQTVAKLGGEPVKNTPGAHGKRGFKGIGVRPPETRRRHESEEWEG